MNDFISHIDPINLIFAIFGTIIISGIFLIGYTAMTQKHEIDTIQAENGCVCNELILKKENK